MSIIQHKRYQLRAAAGKYWLLDVEQTGGTYRAPLAMNESGAMILETYWKTGSLEETAEMMHETFEIGKEEALQDAREFLQSLHLKE